MRRIGIITNDQNAEFQREVISGVQQIAQAQQISVLIDSIEEVRGQMLPVSLPIEELDGIVVIANVLPDHTLASLAAIGKPVTMVSHRVAGLMLPAIIQNNADGIERLVRHLVIDCGCERIVYVSGDLSQHDGVQRQRYFHAAMLRHDRIVQEAYCLRGDFLPDVAERSLRAFLARGLPFDALLAADHLMALRLVPILLQAGYRVPDDVCVVGFGDGAEAQRVGLTTVGVDVVELGRRAGRQLVAQMNGKPLAGVTWLNNQLIERSSTLRRHKK
jgi:LacI family transcriptional regulator